MIWSRIALCGAALTLMQMLPGFLGARGTMAPCSQEVNSRR